MLIGAGIWAEIVRGEIIREHTNAFTYLAQRTSLGWTVFAGPDFISGTAIFAFHALDSNVLVEASLFKDLQHSIQRFWEIEAIPPRLLLTRDDMLAEEIFVSTHTRDQSTGQNTVAIPFREQIPALGDSKQVALRRLRSMESRLAQKPELAQEYHNFIEDYLSTGHMIPAPPPPAQSSNVYYIPYHAIFKKKFRIVFEASCATTTIAS